MLNFVKVMTTVAKFKVKGMKPTIHRNTETHPGMERGYFIRIGNGGVSGEALMRVNMGNSYSLFPLYNRKNALRANGYVPIKGDKVPVLR